MAQPTQFSFELSEVADILIKAQGLHEGRWALEFEINVSIGTFGPSPAEVKPGAILQIANVQLVRQADGVPQAPHIVDAGDSHEIQ